MYPFSRKILNILLIVFFNLSLTFLTKQVHAISDCCKAGCSTCYSRNLQRVPPTRPCTIGCWFPSGKSSCNFKECLNFSLQDTLITTVDIRDNNYLRIMILGKDNGSDYSTNVNPERWYLAFTRAESTPVYLRNLSFLF